MKLGRFLTTLGVGAVIGMLFAPKKGSELREDLKEKGKDTLDTAKNMTKEDYQDLINKTIDDVKLAIDEFDVEEFKDTTMVKLNELKTKLEEVANDFKDSESYASLKDSLGKVTIEITNKVDEIKEKIEEQDFNGFENIDEDIDEIEDELDVILDDLKD